MGILRTAIDWTKQDLARPFQQRTLVSDTEPTDESTRTTLPIGSGVQPLTWEQLAQHQPVTVESAMGLVPVFRSIEIIVNTVSQLDLGVYDLAGQPKPVPLIIRHPEPVDSLHSTLRKTATSLVTRGNAYWRVIRTPNNPGERPVAIEVLDPDNMTLVHPDNKGQDYWRYGNKRLELWEVKHMKLNHVWGNDYGVGPIERFRVDLGGSMQQRDYQQTWFKEASVPTGVLSSDQELTAESAAELKARFIKSQEERSVAVLGKGLTYATTMIKPADAQFLETAQFNITQTARMFGLPAMYLLAEISGNAMTYQNMQDVNRFFVETTIINYLKTIEDAFSDLMSRSKVVRFKTEGFLRAQPEQRYASYSEAIGAGWMTVNEVRAKEGLLPLAEPATPNTQEEEPNDGTESV